MIKNRTVYALKHTNDGDDIYMGSTSKPLEQCLDKHKNGAKKGEVSRLYNHMRETGVDKWWIVTFLCFSCTKNTIRETCDIWVDRTGSIHVSNKEPLQIMKKQSSLQEYMPEYYQQNREEI